MTEPGHKIAVNASEPSYSTGHRFQKGNHHGKGRNQGSRNKATLALQQLLDGEAEALTHKAVELALAGDTTALRLCLERLIPTVRERRIALKLPELKSTDDAKRALNLVLEAVANGSITPGEGQTVTALIEAYIRDAMTDELSERINTLEQRLEAKTRGR